MPDRLASWHQDEQDEELNWEADGSRNRKRTDALNELGSPSSVAQGQSSCFDFQSRLRHRAAKVFEHGIDVQAMSKLLPPHTHTHKMRGDQARPGCRDDGLRRRVHLDIAEDRLA